MVILPSLTRTRIGTLVPRQQRFLTTTTTTKKLPTTLLPSCLEQPPHYWSPITTSTWFLRPRPTFKILACRWESSVATAATTSTAEDDTTTTTISARGERETFTASNPPQKDQIPRLIEETKADIAQAKLEMEDPTAAPVLDGLTLDELNQRVNEWEYGDLLKECKFRGLSPSGKKWQMQRRLHTYYYHYQQCKIHGLILTQRSPPNHPHRLNKYLASPFYQPNLEKIQRKQQKAYERLQKRLVWLQNQQALQDDGSEVESNQSTSN